MYKILGADGKEYGPVDVELLRRWVKEGRVNVNSRLQEAGSSEWKAAGQIAEIADLLGGPPPGIPGQPQALQPPLQNGLAITSLVLGILGVLCLGLLTGIPAIICGHLAHNRARRQPNLYGGGGLALAGFVLGYASVLISFLMLAMLFPAITKAKSRAQQINCVNNLKQVGLAFKIWALDNQDSFPFNVSTNNGGTLEWCAPDADGFDKNAFRHLMAMSNELSTPKILVCPEDTKTPSIDWQTLAPSNVSYWVRSGTNITDATPTQVLARCPIHGTELYCDGSVQQKPKRR
jgi:hypothetical protein